MINNLSLKNFKAFEELSLPLGGFNLLAGLNGMGKSTVIQALLLLKQSFTSPTNQSLLLNGEYTQLGFGKDVLYENATEDVIGIGVNTDKASYALSFRYEADNDKLKAVGTVPAPGEMLTLLDRIFHLSAERITPQTSYSITAPETADRRDFGKNGVYALQYLEKNGSVPVRNKALLLGDESQNSLLRQVSMWMDAITPGANVEVLVNKTLQSAELRYSFRHGVEVTNSYRSMNVGFGLTYVLPVIVQLLAAEAGDILLVENPEAHIHPAGQSMLGELMARAASYGVQIIVETHSDHFLNGLRVAVKRGVLPAEQVRLFYFQKDPEDSYRHTVTSPVIGSDGQLDHWPKGFMDEWENMLLELLQ